MRASFAFRFLAASGLVAAALALLPGCGDDDPGLPPHEPALDDFLPDVPEPTGEPQTVWAGQITEENAEEIIPGASSTAMAGDYFMRNARGRFEIGAATRVVGVVPQGGNVIGAAPLNEEGEVIGGDQFGELSFAYLLGRTCEAETVEVVRDGSAGGAAVIRARGVAAANDYINLRGIGAFNVPKALNPDVEDDVECAVTYVLERDSPILEVRWTLFNPREEGIEGPFASVADTGGNIGAFSPVQGFERLGLGAISNPGDPSPVDYVVYQGPGVSYGALPVHESDDTPNAHFLVAGVSVLLYGGESLLDILNEDVFYLDLPGQSGVTHGVDFMVGRDAADVEAAFVGRRQEEPATLAGEVTWSASGDPAKEARVGIYEDKSDGGAMPAEEPVRTYADTDAQGAFEAELAPGDYVVRAEVEDMARSDSVSVTLPGEGDELSLELPDPVVYDYNVVDGAAGDELIPAKITVIGEHPARPNGQIFDTYDRVRGVVRMIQSIRGTSVVGSDPDEPLRLPAGSTYKIIATRGTEWSHDSVVVSPEPGQERQELDFELWRVAEPEGYVSSEFHVHAIGSPDSPVPERDRVATAAVDGVEVFAQTDHDFVADLQPLIEDLGLEHVVRAIAGVEVTPFVYGHFNAFPLEPDDTSPNGGAIDWGRGNDGYAMLPGEIFEAARERGADVVQVNHPRASAGSLSDFQSYFDRAGLSFDYEERVIEGDLLEAPVPNEWMRLPAETSLWDHDFDALELWNNFDVADTNEDGVRETARLDLVMADWFNFLSLGFDVTPIGSSDTHTVRETPMGMPRTYVRVTDDSPAALESGHVTQDVVDTLRGAGAARDVVLTNAPHLEVSAVGYEGSVLGDEIEPSEGSVTLQIRGVAPSWAHLDTLELFANETPPTGVEAEPLQPLACFTSREEPSEPCVAASTFGDLQVEEVPVEGAEGVTRFEIDLEVTLAAEDIETREGGDGEDAWVVARLRGSRGIFPLFLTPILRGSNLGVFVEGSAEERAEALEQTGVPATAVTSPTYVDFDGGGYRAPFAPQ